MTHPLVLALFPDSGGASAAARAVRELGVDRRDLSIVARSHAVEGELAERLGGSPGVEMEDSRTAAVLGDLGGHLLAAIGLVLPGVGPIIAGGPLAAGLGEAAGHVAGGLPSILQKSGLPRGDAERWGESIEQGAILLGVHVRAGDVDTVRASLERSKAIEVATLRWEE